MNVYLVLGAVFVAAGVFALALCRAAKQGDEMQALTDDDIAVIKAALQAMPVVHELLPFVHLSPEPIRKDVSWLSYPSVDETGHEVKH